ncbi:MAG: hypothetical protein ACR2OC_02655 [Solirubrobacterales bacterium]
MPAGDYVGGFLFFAPTIAAALAGAWLVLSRRFAQLEGAVRLVAYGMIATLAVLAIHVLPLALGVLSRPTVLAAAVVFVALAALVPLRGGDRGPEEERVSIGTPAAGALAGVGVALLALFVLAIARDQLFLAPLSVDTLNFHVPAIASWIQSGSIWQIDAFLPDVAPGHYPANGDVLALSAALPFSNDFLSHFAIYPSYLLTGVATYALALELRATRAAAIAPATRICSMPAVIVPALIAGFPDAVMLFGFATGLLFLIRHGRSGATSELVLAGLSLGLAFGAKWYGVSAVAVVVLGWAAVSLYGGGGLRMVLRHGFALTCLVALAGGIWMLRNWLESGNPVFPVRVAPLGIEIFDAPRDLVREAGGFTLADYLGDPGVWTGSILPQFRDVLAFAGLVLAGGLLATAWALFTRRHRQAPGRPLALAGFGLALVLLAVYFVTPYTAGGPPGDPFLAGSDSRYAIPALLLVAVLCAWTASRFRHGSTALAGLALLAVGDGVLQVSDSSLSAASIGANDWLAALLVAALAVGTGLALPRVRRALEPPLARRAAIGIVVVLGLGLALVGGYEMQKRFNGVRYVSQDSTIDYVLREAGGGKRVGLSGLWDNGISPVLPAFGNRFENEVEYVGTHGDGFIHRYTSRRSFIAALRKGRFDLLFVGHGIPRQQSLREERWARAAGWETVARSERLTLLGAPPRDGAASHSAAASDRENVVAEEQADGT